MPNALLSGLYKFREVFSNMDLHNVMKGGIPCMGSSPGRACAYTHQQFVFQG